MGEGDQALAVLPFKGEVLNSIPTGFKESKTAGDKPDANLKLRYAHGFRSFDTRGNLKYLSEKDIVFTTAALGVVLDKNQNT
jgi:HELP motif